MATRNDPDKTTLPTESAQTASKPTAAAVTNSFEQQLFGLVLAQLAARGVPAEEAAQIAKVYAEHGSALYK